MDYLGYLSYGLFATMGNYLFMDYLTLFGYWLFWIIGPNFLWII